MEPHCVSRVNKRVILEQIPPLTLQFHDVATLF